MNAALPAFALLVSALFALHLVNHLVANSMCCADDASNATVAKNLANGLGYVSSYHPTAAGDTSLPRFDPFITTSNGPVLTLLAAVAIRLFGNRYWVPGAVVLATSLLLLGVLLRQLATSTGDPRRWVPATVVATAALNLITAGNYEQWYALLGEIPAFLLVSLAVLRILGPGTRCRDYISGGLLLGLAFQVKQLAVLSLPVVLAFTALSSLRSGNAASPGPDRPAGGRHRWRSGLRGVIVVAAFSGVPTLAFEAYKLAELGPSGYRQVKVAEAELFQATPGSGLEVFGERAIEHARATSARNWLALCDYFGTGWSAVAYLAALALGLAAGRRWLGHDSSIPLALTAIAAAHTTWWLLASAGGRIRYLLIGLGLWTCAVVFDLSQEGWSARKLALAVAFTAALLPRAQYLPWVAPPRPFFEPSARTAAMLDTVRFLEASRRGKVIAADWWASGVEFEYLLAGSNNLVHQASLGEPGTPDVLFVENAKWIDLLPSIRAQWDQALVRFGAAVVFERGPYRVYMPSSGKAQKEPTRSMYSRIVRQELGAEHGTVELRDEGILIHPGVTPTSVTFALQHDDRQLHLRLFIAPLGSEGAAVPEAGTVNAELLLDGRSVYQHALDRTTRLETTLDVAGARELTVRVDNGNGKAWWDWFFLSVVDKAGTAATSPDQEPRKTLVR